VVKWLRFVALSPVRTGTFVTFVRLGRIARRGPFSFAQALPAQPRPGDRHGGLICALDP